MVQTRSPAVAGYFYPAESDKLETLLGELLQGASEKPRSLAANIRPKAIIAPHAGYIYSGPVAASVYAEVHRIAQTIKRVILLGPAHRLAFSGLALPSCSQFATPLGTIPLDTAGIETALRFPQVQILDEAHEGEHSLEVQLPFLQKILHEFSLVPFAVGEASAQEVGEVMQALWGGEETLIVVSSDLSHYHDYETARRIDQETSNAILKLNPEKIDYEQACGRDPVNGLLYLAKKQGLKPYLLDLRNSGDTAGTRHRVVGYGAYLFA